MAYRIFIIILAFLIVAPNARAQDKGLDRLIKGELKMTPPSIYFKHNSTEYTTMPYMVDSCFRYIAHHIKDINDLVIWRDTLETEKLTAQRIKKLRAELGKRRVMGIHIESMGKAQKISRQTIEATTDSAQIKYLLSLNSVFEISKIHLTEKKIYTDHVRRPRIFCGSCWKNGFHIGARHKLRQMDRRMKRSQQANQKQDEKKPRRRLVWTGWKTGFHWSTAGKS